VVCISAKTGEGLEELSAAIAKRLDRGDKKVTLKIPYDQGAVLDFLYREAKVESVDYADAILVTAVCTPKTLGQVRQFCDPPLPEEKEPWEL
jgi:GTP-binding protein HflX